MVMRFTTGIVFFTSFLVSFVVEIAWSFNLFGSMDDARDALMQFYDPVGSSAPAPTTKAKPLRNIVKPQPIKPNLNSKTSYGLSSLSFITLIPKVKFHRKVATGSSIPIRMSSKTAVKSVTKKRASANKFIEAIEDIEKALADAQQIVRRVNHDARRLQRMLELIKTAVQKRSYRFARKAIGEAMFTIMKMKERNGRKRGKRATVVSSKHFLRDLKQKIGGKAFNKLLAMQGQVTLMFAIDRTGSMSEEIDTAKKIAESIVNQNRPEPVDYILSPFSDPESSSGPVKYYSESERSSFVQALKDLTAEGGGDCPELTFKGMSDAIDDGQPQLDSPMYVFTDAGPKDGNEDKKTYLLEIAQALGVVINFFILDDYCSKTDDVSPFEEIARKRTGQVFRLKTNAELQQLKGLTAVSLGGTAVISNALENVARRRRSTSKKPKSYKIPVDDSIDTLIISVTTDKSQFSGTSRKSWSVSLTTPSGNIAGVTPRNLDKGTVYQIPNPSVGVWTLGISNDNSVRYDYYAKATSVNNIDFEYYFVKKSRKGSFIPTTSPVQGQEARAILTLGGVEKIDKSSLQAELMALDGNLLKTGKPVSLKSEDKAGIRHSFTFTPPGQLFKIKLKGKTKKGNSFERVCHNAIKSETLLIKVLYVKNDFAIPRGGSSFVIFTIENHGNSEIVEIRVFGSMGKVERISKTSVVIRKRRQSSFSVKYTSDATAVQGVTITIVASVKGKSSGSKSTLSIPLLVV